MTEPRQLHPEQLFALVQVEDLDHISYAELERLFRAEEEIADFRPDGTYQIDPRNGDRIVFNTARSRRPHDNRPEEGKPVPASTRSLRRLSGANHGHHRCGPAERGLHLHQQEPLPHPLPLPTGGRRADSGPAPPPMDLLPSRPGLAQYAPRRPGGGAGAAGSAGAPAPRKRPLRSRLPHQKLRTSRGRLPGARAPADSPERHRPPPPAR